MAARFDTITFLSDYGTGDEFVGVVKSVIRQIAPARHRHRPHPRGARLRRAGRQPHAEPVGAVPVPGRGPGGGRPRRRHRAPRDRGRGRRRAELPRRPRQRPAGGRRRHVRRRHRRPSSSPTPTYQLAAPGPTFAGRDVFAPAAAHLCAGVPLADLGRPIDPLSLLPGLLPLTREEDGALVAEVLWVDRYGNCQLNVDPDEVAAFGPRVQLRWGDDVRTAERSPTYEGIAPGPGRPRRRQLRDAVGLPRQALRRRGAPPRRRHRGRPRRTLR